MAVGGKLKRKKTVAGVVRETSMLDRVLTTTDLTALGVGSTIGVGVYVLPGALSKYVSGPAVVVSFFIAAIASVFAGLCYAELSSRVPKAGSAYSYAYIAVGELAAFIVGWNLLLEYSIGGASIARGLSLYVDALCNKTMETAFRSIYVLDLPYLSEYFDFFAMFIVIVFSVALACGLKDSVRLNNFFTLVNCAIMVMVIAGGCFHIDFKNWSLPKAEVPNWAGEGGFMPYGLQGALQGAATCFYGFVGFDCIATSGEEVKNPQKSLPLAIILSLFIVFLAYSGVSAVLTLMIPYYAQDADMPISYAFDVFGWSMFNWIIGVGAIFGMCACMFGAMYPLPRILYAMSNDGLIFEGLGRVHPKFKTPFIGTMFAGTITALLNLKQLVDMMTIGTLLVYVMVAVCVLFTRYREESDLDYDMLADEYIESTTLTTLKMNYTKKQVLKQLFNYNKFVRSNNLTSYVASLQTTCFTILCLPLSLYLTHWYELDSMQWKIAQLLIVIMIIQLISISLQPASKTPVTFKVPFVPITPALSIFINIYLMFFFDIYTWARFIIWMIIGFAIYFGYGIRHSKENSNLCTPIAFSGQTKLNIH
ncbi:high affinity cationic amino acid transporter 1-like isoform X2 [Adelges cooleyi]|uniref:high affinity cationic amino acid transporter 1-like isoform X2 n=1 Tax=Adelges cooleyi TaxID=133065 RepID=UPI002180175D|nr:high affinity cationic amino acid transporter 1-like isoform X2 [Adelges cooleyi]